MPVEKHAERGLIAGKKTAYQRLVVDAHPGGWSDMALIWLEGSTRRKSFGRFPLCYFTGGKSVYQPVYSVKSPVYDPVSIEPRTAYGSGGRAVLPRRSACHHRRSGRRPRRAHQTHHLQPLRIQGRAGARDAAAPGRADPRHIEQRAAAQDAPERKLAEVLQVHAEMLTSEGFHGCPLILAAVQAPDSDRGARARARAQGMAPRTARTVCPPRRMKSPDALAVFARAHPRRRGRDVRRAAGGSRRQARARGLARVDRRPYALVRWWW